MDANHIRQQGFTLFEMIVVSIVIGIIVALGVGYYTQAVKDSQKASVELLANRFTAVTALLHAQWITEGKPSQIALEDEKIRFNRQGWPVGVVLKSHKDPEDDKGSCFYLWHALFQNPARLANEQPQEGFSYYTTGQAKPSCQYHLITNSSENFYFEYFPSNGKVISRLASIE